MNSYLAFLSCESNFTREETVRGQVSHKTLAHRSVDAVSARGLLKIGTRVRVTPTRKDLNLMALAVVRVAKPRTGMGLEFLEVDADSNKTLLAWIGSLRQLR